MGILTMVKIGITLAVLAAIYYAWTEFTDHYVQIGVQKGRAEVQTVFDDYKNIATKRTSDMVALWDRKRLDADKLAEERDHANQDRIAEARKRAAALPAALAGIRVPAAVVRLLNDDATDAGHPADIAGPAGAVDGAVGPPAAGIPDAQAGRPPGAADEDSTLGLVVEWVAVARAKYGECVDRVDGLVAFYRGLQAAQPPPEKLDPLSLVGYDELVPAIAARHLLHYQLNAMRSADFHVVSTGALP